MNSIYKNNKIDISQITLINFSRNGSMNISRTEKYLYVRINGSNKKSSISINNIKIKPNTKYLISFIIQTNNDRTYFYYNDSRFTKKFHMRKCDNSILISSYNTTLKIGFFIDKSIIGDNFTLSKFEIREFDEPKNYKIISTIDQINKLKIINNISNLKTIYITNQKIENYLRLSNILDNRFYRYDSDIIEIKCNTSTLNQMCDHIYIFTLKNKNEVEIQKEYFEKYGVEIEYFDGFNAFESDEIIKYYNDYLTWELNDPRVHPLESFYKRKLIKSIGAFGVLRSFKNILIDMKSQGYERVIIFEDDVIFDKDINYKLIKYISHINNSYLTFLGSSQYLWKNAKNITDKLYQSLIATDGAFALYLSIEIVDELLEQIELMNCPFDSGPLRYIIQKYPEKCLTIYPSLIIADTCPHSKTMNQSRNLKYHYKNVGWDLKNLDFTVAYWKVSIIIANYNSSDTIKYTLTSILNQTYKNIEVIIVDDCSTDNCLEIIYDFIDNNDNIFLYQMKKNSGAYKCRNFGLSKSTGMFISLVDADDIILSDYIERNVYEYFTNEHSEIIFSNIYRSNGVKFNKIDDDEILERIENERKPYLFTNKKKYIFGHNAPWNYKYKLGLATIFVHREFFDKYGRWNDKYRYSMDIELIQRYMVKKYQIFIDNKILWNSIYKNEMGKYGINLMEYMGYVSFPMNNNNATIICNKDDLRESIHEDCDSKLKLMLDKKCGIESNNDDILFYYESNIFEENEENKFCNEMVSFFEKLNDENCEFYEKLQLLSRKINEDEMFGNKINSLLDQIDNEREEYYDGIRQLFKE